MLRGIHKASSTWLGQAIMAVVMGVLVDQLRHLGHRRHFPRLRRSIRSLKIGSTEISIDQFRQFYNDRLQQLSRQARPADHARPGARARPRPADARPVGRRDHARRAGRATAARPRRCRDRPAASPAIRISAASTANSTATVSSSSSASRLQRRPLRRRAAPRAAAPADRAEPSAATLRVPTTDAGRRSIRFQNEKRSIEYVTLGPAQAGDIPQPTPETAQQIFRRTQGRVPRAGVSQDHAAVADAGRSRQARRGHRRRRQGLLRAAQGKLRHARAARAAADRISRTPEEAAAARERIAKGTSFADLAKERGLKDDRHRSRHGGEEPTSSIRRSPTPPSRSSPARSARRSRRSSAPCCCKSARSSRERRRAYDEVAPQIKREIAENRAKTEIGDAARQDRGRARRRLDAGRDRQEVRTQVASPSTRSTAPAAARTASSVADLPKAPDVVAAAFASDVGVDNDAAAAARRRLSLVRRHRHHAVARTHARRGQGPGRDALARRRDRQAPAGQDRRHARQAQGRHDAGAARDRNRPQGGDRSRPAARQAGRLAPAKLVEAVFKTPKDAPAAAEGEQRNRALRLSRDRHRPIRRSIRRRRTPSSSIDDAAELLRRRPRRRICHAAGNRPRRHAQPAGAQPDHRRRRQP